MGRSTVYNNIVTDEKWDSVSKENKTLLRDFIEYNYSCDRSRETIKQYESQLRIFFVWNMENNENKFFVTLKKKDLLRFLGYLQNTLKHSPNRVASLKSVLSSLSNYIERYEDEEYPNFRNIVKILEIPQKQNIRPKTILTQADIDKCLIALVDKKKYQVACYFALAVACGARKSELCRFKINYFKDEYIKYGCLYETPEEMKTKGKGKRGKPLKKYTFIKQFKPFFDLWVVEREKLGINSEWLFVTNSAGGYTQATSVTATSWAKTISSILGCEFYIHALRHVWCSQAKANGLPDDVILALQGWSSADMIKIYNDNSIIDSFEKYFDENGIKDIKETKLTDL